MSVVGPGKHATTKRVAPALEVNQILPGSSRHRLAMEATNKLARSTMANADGLLRHGRREFLWQW